MATLDGKASNGYGYANTCHEYRSSPVPLSFLKKLKHSPGLGEKLGHKAGLDLTGYRKLYAYKKKIRIVYRIHEGKLLIFIVAVGKREDMSVYQSAFDRIT